MLQTKPQRRHTQHLFTHLKLSRRPHPACRHDQLDVADLKARICLGHCGRTMLTDRDHRVCSDCTRYNAAAPPPKGMDHGMVRHTCAAGWREKGD